MISKIGAFYLQALQSQNSNFHKIALRYLEQLQGIQKVDYQLPADTSSAAPLKTFSLSPMIFSEDISNPVDCTELNFLMEKISKEEIFLMEEISTEKLTATNLLASLQEWKLSIPKTAPTASIIFYLYPKIRQLPYPNTPEGNIWTELSEKEYLECLALLKELNDLLYTSKSVFCRNLPYESQKILECTCKLMAITDFFGKKYPESGLEGFTVNFYGVLIWIKKYNLCLNQPEVIHSLEQFCNYISPDLDIYNLPPLKELEKRAAQTLFYYPNVKFTDCRKNHPFVRLITFNWVGSSQQKWKEWDYFENLLAKPGFKEKFLRDIVTNLNPVVEEEEFHFLLNNLQEEEWLKLLFSQQHKYIDVDNRSYPLFSPVYSFLRSLVLQTNQLFSEDANTVIQTNYGEQMMWNVNLRPETPLDSKRRLFSSLSSNKLLRVIRKADLKFCQLSNRLPELFSIQSLSFYKKTLKYFNEPKITDPAFNKYPFIEDYFVKTSQSKIFSRILKIRYSSKEQMRFDTKLLEVHSASKGGITRLLGLFRNNSTLLDEASLHFLSCTLFEKGYLLNAGSVIFGSLKYLSVFL